MTTTRRGFLKLFSGAVAAAALIPVVLRDLPKSTPHIGPVAKRSNFAALDQRQLKVWSRELWTQARNEQFMRTFVGGDNAVIQLVTELH